MAGQLQRTKSSQDTYSIIAGRCGDTAMTVVRLLLSLFWLPFCHGLSAVSRMAAVRSASSLLPLAAVSQLQVAALDGAEWISLQSYLMERHQIPRGRFSEMGSMTIVTGTTDDNTRIVGIQATNPNDDTIALDDSTHVYKDSYAILPNKISDQDAMTTLLGALVGVHCTLPTLEHVGGSDENSFVSGKVLVVGGSEYASFAAEALAALGASVVQVSSGSPNVSKKVETMPPAVGELELGFADVVGEFDALLDCISDEAKLAGMRVEESDDLSGLVMSGVVAELRKQHKCHRYVSTLSHSQRIIQSEGVLWGPNKAKAHLADISKVIASGTSQQVVPPLNFSSTLQTLLDKGITWKQKKEKVLVRGWTLKDFWELTSWPRDSAGAGDTRYGLPVMEDLDTLFQERMISDPPAFSKSRFHEEEKKAREEQVKADAENPYVMTIKGVEGLQRDIIAAEKDCILFLSAPWCRTCRYLGPQYTRMAREASVGMAFAKADVTGNIGKALGKALEVDAVPAFVFFRQGEVFGSPLSVSRLPSKKLERAIDCLASGMEWNSCVLNEDDYS